MNLKGLHRNRVSYIGIGLILLLAIAIGFRYYQSLTEFTPANIEETNTIPLEKSSDTRRLTIFENEQIIISINNDQYLSYAKSSTKLPEFSHIVESNSDEIESFLTNGVMPQDFSAQSALIVEMLNSGKVSVYDKQAKREFSSITEHYRNLICGPLCGEGSISFYFPDGRLLYKGPEWRF